MPVKFFSISALDPGVGEVELNAFLRAQRAVSIRKELVVNGGCAVWCVAVEYLERKEQSSSTSEPAARRDRIDYREVLSAEVFARFSKLREKRKQISEAEAVPVYAVLTNEQLAAIAQKMPQSLAELLAIEGIGEGKAKRYGETFLAVVAEMTPSASASVAAQGARNGQHA